jgi:DNA (cytosine-5)-methyltransferase 1
MRAVELFAGAGGLGIGVSRAGFIPAAVIEWNRFCCDTLRENQLAGLTPIVDWPLTEGDVRNFDFSDIHGNIDLVSGGPPCQPFSLGGKHKGHLDNRDMFPQAIRAVRELRPKAFIFENVKGLTRSSFASYLEYIRLGLTYPEIVVSPDEDWPHHLARLERYHTQGKHDGLFYNVVIQLLNAADYGIPQRRERVFIVGFRSDLDIGWSFPEKTHGQDALLWTQWQSGEYWDKYKVATRDRPEGGRNKMRGIAFCEQPRFLPWLTVRDAIADLPDPETNPKAAAAFNNHRFQSGARSYAGHTGSPLDEPAKTLKAGDHGVPGGENMLLRVDGSVRYFTVRESARLQTFPDEFLFHGSWTETMRQLGNAVPVKLATIISSSVKSHLALANLSPAGEA